MELLMKNIHMCRQGKQAGLPVTLEEDFNVPDVKPDVEQIIKSALWWSRPVQRTERWSQPGFWK